MSDNAAFWAIETFSHFFLTICLCGMVGYSMIRVLYQVQNTPYFFQHVGRQGRVSQLFFQHTHENCQPIVRVERFAASHNLQSNNSILSGIFSVFEGTVWKRKHNIIAPRRNRVSRTRYAAPASGALCHFHGPLASSEPTSHRTVRTTLANTSSIGVRWYKLHRGGRSFGGRCAKQAAGYKIKAGGHQVLFSV